MNDWNASPSSRDTRRVFYYSDGTWLDEDELQEHDPDYSYAGSIDVPIFTSDAGVDEIVRTTVGG